MRISTDTIRKVFKWFILVSGWVAAIVALWRTDYDPTLWWKVEQLERRLNSTAAETLFLQNYAERLTHAMLEYPRDSIIRARVNSCIVSAAEDW